MPRYFIETIVIFWIPVSLLAAFMWKKMDPPTKKSLICTVLLLTPLTFVMEFIFMWADIWTFSEKIDPLLGIRIRGVPIEEFSFWFGAPPFILLTYLAIRWFLKRGTPANG